MAETTKSFKAGFVNIVGNPNVGKSTLINGFMGEKLSIVTPKMQTTRHRILGFLTQENYQIIFSDTPGIVQPNNELQNRMLAYSFSALEDADVLLYVTDIEDVDRVNDDFVAKANHLSIPLLLVINKIDIRQPDEIAKAKAFWQQKFPDAEIFEVSALKGEGTDKIFQRILEVLPYHPPYFPKDELSDKSERFFVSEIIREKILLNYYEEVPYSVEVQVEEFKEKENITVIKTKIFVLRESQKNIIIGRKGEMIKKVGMQARKDIEKFLGGKVYLELFVKVRKGWRDDENTLKKFGYFD
ncbi:MAG: GTPase Era [Bacteroidales bacterium]|nr:GTPase Era [Bacteroidales bacterium]